MTLFYREGAQDWEGLVGRNGCPSGRRLQWEVRALEGVFSSALDPSEGGGEGQRSRVQGKAWTRAYSSSQPGLLLLIKHSHQCWSQA